MNRRASCFFLLAALLLLGCFPALAIRPQPLETRVGGWEQFASGQTSVVAVQSPENAMGLRGCAYKSASGRLKWLNQDPIQERGGINLYDYVGNNPVNKIDPLGLFGDDPESLPSSNGSQVNGVPALTISVPKGPCGGKATVTNNDSAKELAMMMMAGGGLVVGGGLVLGLAGPDEVVGGGAAVADEAAGVAADSLPEGFVQTGPNTWEGTIEVDVPEPTPTAPELPPGRGPGIGPGPGRGPVGPLPPGGPLGPYSNN